MTEKEGNLVEPGSAAKIWEAALGELELQVSKHNFKTWLEKTGGLGYEANRFTVGVPNTFVAEYLNKNQRSLIEKTLIGIVRRDVSVVFLVANRGAAGDQGYQPEAAGNTDTFNPKYTFDSFVTGSGNRLAYAAASDVARNPGKTYNPLFICGGVGLGKTHLLHAIGHIIRDKNLTACYASCETFTNEFITAIQERRMDEFRSRYRSVDLLMLDDIQFISGKEQTEECLFHTFNELHDHNRQIIMTSDREPKAIPRLTERLRSRFEWGLIVDIQPPDMNTRLEILETKTRQRGEDVPQDVLEYIAQQINHNIRELEGNLNRVIAYAKLLQARADKDLAARALESIATKSPDSTPTLPLRVIEAVASSFQIPAEDLTGLKRDKEISLARQVAMFLIREETSYPLAMIGMEFGHRNPSTVRHACEKITAEIDSSPYLKRQVSAIRERLRAA